MGMIDDVPRQWSLLAPGILGILGGIVLIVVAALRCRAGAKVCTLVRRTMFRQRL